MIFYNVTINVFSPLPTPWSSQHIHELPLVLVFGIATSPMIIHGLLPHSVSSLLCIELFQSLSCKEHLSTIIDKVIPFLNRNVCIQGHVYMCGLYKQVFSEAFGMESVPESCEFGNFLLITAEQLINAKSFLSTLIDTCFHLWFAFTSVRTYWDNYISTSPHLH